MKKAKVMLAAISISVLMQSCMTTRTDVGSFKEDTGTKYTYSKAHQLYLFWGLLRIGHVKTNTPSNGSCQVKTAINFGDALISTITGGIITSQTIKVVAKK